MYANCANCAPAAWIVGPERSKDHPEAAKSPSQAYEDDTVPYRYKDVYTGLYVKVGTKHETAKSPSQSGMGCHPRCVTYTICQQ